MRDASSPEYDGPRNLADAVRAAAEGEWGKGVLVALAGSLIPAEVVVKTHATALDAFRARGEVRAARRRPFAIPARPEESVYLVTAAVGMDGAAIRGLAPLRPRGLVVAATGSGNTHPDMLAAARELMATGTVVC